MTPEATPGEVRGEGAFLLTTPSMGDREITGLGAQSRLLMSENNRFGGSEVELTPNSNVVHERGRVRGDRGHFCHPACDGYG